MKKFFKNTLIVMALPAICLFAGLSVLELFEDGKDFKSIGLTDIAHTMHKQHQNHLRYATVIFWFCVLFTYL